MQTRFSQRLAAAVTVPVTSAASTVSTAPAPSRRHKPAAVIPVPVPVPAPAQAPAPVAAPTATKTDSDEEENHDPPVTSTRPQKGKALYNSCEKGAVSKVRKLLREPNLDVKYRRHSKSALHIACELGHAEVVELLLRASKFPLNEIAHYSHHTPLTTACFHGRFEVTDILLDCEDIAVPNNIVALACASGDVETIQLLLASPKVAAAAEFQGSTRALNSACEKGFIDVVKLLLADPRISLKNRDGGCDPPLYAACRAGDEEIANLLIQHPKCDVNDMGHNGTALYAAVESTRPNIVTRILAQEKFDPSIVPSSRRGALHRAAELNNQEILGLLLGDGRFRLFSSFFFSFLFFFFLLSFFFLSSFFFPLPFFEAKHK
jgi:ankyrin repeat protein